MSGVSYPPNTPSARSSSHTTAVTLPPISILATGSPIKPVCTSLARIATAWLFCRPTATRLPIALVS